MSALLSWGLGSGGTPAAAAVACPSGVESDFNGDGVRDTAIADPEATVDGVAKAGAVHVVYGGGKGSTTVSQAPDNIPGAPETGDRYGFSLAVYDADLDGCSDLVVGTPYEDLGTVPDAGLVQVVYGATAGLGTGKAVKEFLQGTDKPLAGSPEAEDWVGYAVEAGKTSAGTPFLLIGSPGESIGTVEDAGCFYYVSGTAQTVAGVSQDTETAGAVPGVAERDDRFGASLAATPTHFAVGSPGEALGTTVFAGGVGYFSHALTSGSPKPLGGLGQDQADDLVNGAEEVGDQFGAALAMVPYRASGATSTTESLLVVGVPGEDLKTTVDAGAVQVFRLTASGGFSQLAWIDQNTDNVEETAEAGDLFGKRLTAVNTSPNATSTAATTKVAVGVPGEEASEEYTDEGGVQIVPLVGAPGASDQWISPGNGIPGTPASRMLAGLSLAASPSLLYVGVPYGPAGGHAVHGFPWGVTSGGAPTQTIKPGGNGIPAADVAFGAAVR
ncbi:VCBS repeat-containing protein [Streptomyces cylindrosporus]|uniref:VCBS repeat-containing protein n=1 Tax=Streptomyces cylindrosporus TaxID=2927583 RepID=A0ABS9XXJ7_9ACTN|nr:VCBS repeat-containing protein [Streptomyces cylindrosporus]MCI3269683.1 VCBS repeat-containing protein [Streptomyces cylindrosporus]